MPGFAEGELVGSGAAAAIAVKIVAPAKGRGRFGSLRARLVAKPCSLLLRVHRSRPVTAASKRIAAGQGKTRGGYKPAGLNSVVV